MIQESIQNILKTLPENVKLIAVSKTYPRSCIDEALQAGQLDFGENKVQELMEKYRENENIRWHMIGHLQTNKVKYLIGKVATIQSVDSLRLLEVIQKESQKKGVVTHVLLEINLSHEETKFGMNENQLDDIMHRTFSHVSIDGMMVIGPHCEDESRIREVFQKAFELKKKYSFKELSMGMSQDYQLAIPYGTTMVRIGTSIFGARDYSKSE